LSQEHKGKWKLSDDGETTAAALAMMLDARA
jgi:hypothetical protein